MRELFCQDPCGSNLTQPLVSAPCFLCPGSELVMPAPQPAVFGAPPTPQALDPVTGMFIAGNGIPATYAASVQDGVIQLYLAPLIAGVSAIPPLSLHIGNIANYNTALPENGEISVLFGATMFGREGKITDHYDVSLKIEAMDVNGPFGTVLPPTVSLALMADDQAPSGYVWTDGVYTIEDSDGDESGRTAQNVTRPRYLQDAGLPEEAADIPAETQWTIEAVFRETGDIINMTVRIPTILG